ncbi:MAG: hypothetical protein VW274_09385 [Thalassolituus sp.]
MGKSVTQKSQVAIFFGRYWWLFLLPAVFGAYLFSLYALIGIGKQVEPVEAANSYFDVAVSIAPWNADAHVAYAGYLRAYALTRETAEEYTDSLNRVLSSYESAIETRPYWPYYQLGALDAEYLLDSDPQVIQQRYDTIISLTPNERGLDRDLLTIGVLAWHRLRPEQKRGLNERLITTSGHVRSERGARTAVITPARFFEKNS